MSLFENEMLKVLDEAYQQKSNDINLIQQKIYGKDQISQNDDQKIIVKSRKQSIDVKQIDYLDFQPSILKGGMLKSFQLVGLNWIISLYENKRNGILADEMGMGKTIQSIAIIAYLKEFKNILGPHLIVCPLSTLANWMREFKNWLPCCNVVQLPGRYEQRDYCIKNYLKKNDFDVCIATYEGFKTSISDLKKIKFNSFIIDEAHKIKEQNTLISQNTKEIKTRFKLILTGTPLQNNMYEMWCLLNFLNPNIFDDKELFTQFFLSKSLYNQYFQNLQQQDKIRYLQNFNKDLDENILKQNIISLAHFQLSQTIINKIEDLNVKLVQSLQKIILPYMLRRTKKDELKDIPDKQEKFIYMGLTKLQQDIYKNLIKSNNPFGEIDGLKFQMIYVQLIKCCNHPYLFPNVEDESAPLYGDHLIKSCGKMMVLDKLLMKLYNDPINKNQEDYFIYRNFSYCKLDGSTPYEERDRQIQEFTQQDSDKFIFVISTKAGGLGINLASANNVIIYDSDLNPQNDLQAIDRAHRIGQTKTVQIYRLISQDTVEEYVIDRQIAKLKFDKLIMAGQSKKTNRLDINKTDLSKMLAFGAKEVFQSINGTYTDEDIDLLISQGDEKIKLKNQDLQNKLEQIAKDMGDMDIKKIDCQTFNNINYKKQQEDLQLIEEIHASKRNQNNLQTTNKKGVLFIDKQDIQKTFDLIFPEHQYFVERNELFNYYVKSTGLQETNSPNTYEIFIGLQSQIKSNQDMQLFIYKMKNQPILNSQHLSQEEKQAVEQLLSINYPQWSLEELKILIELLWNQKSKNDQINIKQLKNKTQQEVDNYVDSIFKYTENNKIKKQSQFYKVESILHRQKEEIEMQQMNNEVFLKYQLNKFCSKFQDPFDYPNFNLKENIFNHYHNIFILFYANIYGYGNNQKILESLKENTFFKFDIFIKTLKSERVGQRLMQLYSKIKFINLQAEKINRDLSTKSISEKKDLSTENQDVEDYQGKIIKTK